MSAILARVNFDGAPICTESFHRAFEVMAPYGGDGSDTWIKGAVGLGQHLLRFTPESCHERQPYAWDEAIIVADVRIDNRDELCDRFGLSHPDRATTPDSHLILRAYRLWGEDCTAHLLGDFAFAIWDRRAQRMFCARDHIGARPLYYVHSPSAFIAATDIRSLQAFPDVRCDIDELEVASFLLWPRLTKTRTFFTQVHMLHAAEQVCVGERGITRRIHWSPEAAPDVRHKSPAEYAEHFRAVLDAAIAARIRTPYPVAAHLSGGLDSSGVVVLANRQLREQGRSLDMTYTWSPAPSDTYPLGRWDERNTIHRLCKQEDLPVHYGTATGQGFRDFLARDMAVEMNADLFEEFPVLAHASDMGNRSILSGWGGDEAATYAGRGYLAYLLKRGHWRELARITRRTVGIRRPHRTLRFLARHAILPLLPDRLYDRFAPYYRSDRQPSYIHPAFAARFPDAAKVPLSWREIPDPRKTQERLLKKGLIAERMATWAAWSSAYGVLHTYPLTDRRVLEYALGLPPELLYHKGQWRYLFRAALKDVLPPLPPKADPVNEQKRFDCELACWRILADEVRAGLWADDDVPWLDMPRLREKMLVVPDEMNHEHLLEFIPISFAVRVWHLWQRYGHTVGAGNGRG